MNEQFLSEQQINIETKEMRKVTKVMRKVAEKLRKSTKWEVFEWTANKYRNKRDEQIQRIDALSLRKDTKVTEEMRKVTEEML